MAFRDKYYAKYYGKGGGNVQLGKKYESGKKIEKGERKKEKITLKKGEKALKMRLFVL